MSLKDRIDMDEYICDDQIIFPEMYNSREQTLISLLYIQGTRNGVPADVSEIASYTTYCKDTVRPRLHDLDVTKRSDEGWWIEVSKIDDAQSRVSPSR